MIAFNVKSSRKLSHSWVRVPSPMNPSLMRSKCGCAYALAENLSAFVTGLECVKCSRLPPEATGP